MNKILDFLINLIKWPIAVAVLVALPGLIESYERFNFLTIRFYCVGVGILFYFITALTAGSEIRSQIQIIAHELTHTLFAYLTLHFVRCIRLNPDGTGGSMVLRGRGNWLITLAPYFFPLFAFFYMLLLPWLSKIINQQWILFCIYGYFIAYYWATVLSQVHPKQTDIIREGYIFSIIIIIGFNLYTTGCLFAFTNHFWKGVILYSKLVYKFNLHTWHGWLSLIL